MTFIKHKKMKDICAQLLQKQESGKALVRWWNIGMGEPFPIGDYRGFAEEVIDLSRTDKKDWSVYADPRAAQTRA